jgi:iron complex transport system substrate-binding protein
VKNRVPSSGSTKALRIFYLRAKSQLVANSEKRVALSWIRASCSLLAITYLLTAAFALAAQADVTSMKKRRQQGILTGMPFMANVAPRTFVDDLGRKIFLAKAPTRIVSLAPSITETLYALGLNEEIVGVTDFCNYPPEAQRKPKVGYSHANVESIVALQPDLVLAPREFLRADVLGKLEQLKIPTFIMDAKTIEDVPAHIQMLGRMLDRVAPADRVAMDIREGLRNLRSRTEHLPRLRVLYVLNSLPLITVGPGSFLHHLIELAGGENVAAGASTPYPRLSLEEVISKDPEVIIFPVGSVEGIPADQQQQWLRWATMSAVRNGRLREIPSDLLNRPGPRITQGLELLVRIIHPNALPEPASRGRTGR